MRSSSGSPDAWYFLAIETTRRRFDCTNWRSASSPWRAVRRSSRLRGGGDVLAAGVEVLDRLLAGLDRLGQPDLVVLGEQGVLADVGEVQAYEVFVIAFNAIFGHGGSLCTDPQGRCRRASAPPSGDELTIPTRSSPPTRETPCSRRRAIDSWSPAARIAPGVEREYHVPNPMLNDKQFEEARAGWAAPTAAEPGRRRCGRRPASRHRRRSTDGPVSPWRGAMTVRGTITRTAVLFALLLISATVGWLQTPDADARPTAPARFEFPAIAMVGVIVGFAVRHRAVLPADVGQVPRPDLRPRPGLLRRRDLQGLRDRPRRHRPPGRRRHARRVRA